MKTIIASVSALVISLALTASVQAQISTSTLPGIMITGSSSIPLRKQKIGKIERHQDKRIEQGVQSGQLTSAEQAKLESRNAKLEANIATAKSDGSVTKAERASLLKEAKVNSKQIYRAKHNKKTV